jgi:UDP-N-acetylmuramoylalanine--D-glutamate ligase
MKVAIVGYDVEGQASYRYYSRQHGTEITIFDEAELEHGVLPHGVDAVCGPDALDELKRRNDFDLVLRTPGLPLHKLDGINNVSSATQEFLKQCPADVIGVTGTKGKGTTCSLIHAILQAEGKTSWLVGNIGTPALDVLDKITADDVVVYEMSSFQLWDVTVSPQVAVVTMVEPDHLDRHTDLEDYVSAKANIRRFQKPGDSCIYYPDNELSARVAQVELADQSTDIAPARRFGVADDGQVYVTSNTFCIQNDPICDVSELRLPGRHNLMNACAAISAARIAANVTNEAVAKGLASFQGLPHRLKFVAYKEGISYYDDSIATTPGSAIAAIDSFPEAKVLILGGSDKGATYDELVHKIAESDSMRGVICIGEVGNKLADQLDAATSYIEIYREPSKSMSDIVKRARIIAQDGDVVVLSPAAASFDMFKSYADRGDQFVQAVSEL